MFSDYVKERGKEYIETEHGFAVYHMEDINLHIDEIFIMKEFRKDKKASELIDILASMAQVNDKKFVTCCCDVESVDSSKEQKSVKTGAIKAALSYGFIPHEAHNSRLTFHKEV